MAQSKSLEVRVNSLDDARSVVAQSQRIVRSAKSNDCASIEIFLEEGIRAEAVPIMSGAFGAFKVFYKFIKPENENVLFTLPHLKSFNVQIETNQEARKPVRPKLQPA